MSELLYLDTARLGRMSPGAATALRDFVALAGDEGGGLYLDRFLAGGLPACPDPFAARYPGLAGWRGIGGLKADLRSLADGRSDLPVLLASRSASLVKLAARLLFHPCRNVLTTDLDWPVYAATLAAEASRGGRTITTVAVRDAALSGRLSEDELVDRVCRQFAEAGCDGLYLTAVSNLGVRLPCERIVRRLEADHTVRVTVVDGAQEFGQFPPADRGPYCDLYLAGSHKWLGGYHPLSIGFYGRGRSRDRVETILGSMTRRGDLDDPLLRFSTRLEAGVCDPLAETVNLTPLFSTQGAVGDSRGGGNPLPARLSNLDAAATVAAESGWRPLLPSPALRSGILILQCRAGVVRTDDPETTRASLRRGGVAATAYPGGLIRLSMPSIDFQGGQLNTLSDALRLDR